MSASTHRAAARGFTLVELSIGLVVAAIIALGAVALLGAQQHAYQSSSGDRGRQEAARTAIEEISGNLRRAGYGVEPWNVFDFTTYPAGPPDGTTVDCSTSKVTCRDSTGGPDEIVFFSRDPAWGRGLAAAASSTQLTLSAPLKAPLYAGQILQLMCNQATATAYVTVSTKADVGAVNVSLDGAPTNTFANQQGQLTAGSCYGSGYQTTRVFKVDRFHYYIANYTEAGALSSTSSATARPYLMLDRGLKDGTKLLLEPVTPDVEDLQFAYVFGSGTTVVGNVAGTRLAATAASIDVAATPPAFGDPVDAASFQTHHPANILAVQISVVIRSATQDLQLTSADAATVPAAGNRAANTSATKGYMRTLVSTTAATQNLRATGPYFPPYSTNSGADGYLVGGG